MTDLSVSGQDVAVHSGYPEGDQEDSPEKAGAADGPGPPRRRAARPGVLLAIVLAGQFMAVLDASVVNVAAPSIHAGLHASGAGLQLVIAGYTIAYAVLLVTGARLGDLLGHRHMFLSGLALFTAASLGCGLAMSTGLLIALRFVQGVGAAIMIPQVLSLIQRTFTGTSRARAMSAYSAVLAGGVVVGQIAGGLLISADLLSATWRPVFLVNVPIGLVLLAAGWRLLPAGQREPGRGLDIPGLLTLSPAVLALVVPLVLGFAAVSLNWQRLPDRVRPWLAIGGFAGMAIGLATLASLLHGGGTGGAGLYAALALTGGCMAAAFSPLMTSVLMRVPVADAADATGMIVTVNQLALVVGVATFGTLYLNLAGRLPGQPGSDAFRLLSAHAAASTCAVLAAISVAGGLLAVFRTLVLRAAVRSG